MYLKTMGTRYGKLGTFKSHSYKPFQQKTKPFQKEYGDNWELLSDKRKKLDNFTCTKCGWYAGPENRRKLHVHHIIPLKKGGSNTLSNLTTVCWKCHEKIHHKKLWH